MNFKFTWILFAVLLLGAGGLLVSSLLDDKPSSSAVLLVPLAGADPDSVDTITMVRTVDTTTEKLVFSRKGKFAWELKEPTTGRVEFSQLNTLATALLKLKPTPTTTLGSPAVHGLDSPSLTVTLTANGKSATLNVGDTSVGGADRAVTFVTTDTRPRQPVAVKRSDLEVLFKAGTTDGKAAVNTKWIPDFRQKRLLPDGDLVTSAESIKLFKGGKELGLVRATSGDWSFTAPVGYGQADLSGDPAIVGDAITGVRPLVNALSGLQAFDVADFIERPNPLETYGLKSDDPNVLRVELKPKDGPAEVLYIGKRVEEQSPTNKFYCKRADDPVVIKAALTPEKFNAVSKVTADPGDLRDRTLIADTKKDVIDAVDVTTKTGTTKLRRLPVGAENRWAMYGGPTDPQFANLTVADLLSAVCKPRAAKEVLAAPFDAVFTDAEKLAELKLWFDGCEKPAPPKEADKLPDEPKFKGDGKPSVTLIVGKIDSDLAYVRRIAADGSKTDFRVPVAGFTAVVAKDRGGFLDASFKSFATNIVRKFSFNRGTTAYELNNDGLATAEHPTGKWTFNLPEAMKGQIADGQKTMELVTTTATFAPVRVIAENPPEADLAKFGLATGTKTKVTVTLDEKEKNKEFVYELGNETDDKQFVYARQIGRSVVVTLVKSAVDKFQSQDLRDRLLYTFDQKKVTAVQLFGWKTSHNGQPTTYRFEKVNGAWTTKQPADPKVVVDPVKLEAFLSILAMPRVTTYLPNEQKPEQGYDPANGVNTLMVKFELEGGDMVELNLANPTDGGQNFFGWCNRRKDDLFTIPALALREFKDRPQSLLK